MSVPFPALPKAPSWFPGHMRRFQRMLPSLLTRTDVVLEIRDARLPLTSINRSLEGALNTWRKERGWNPHSDVQALNSRPCEHLVVLNKRDLVPEWGMEPFQMAMTTKFPHQTTFFASFNRPRDIRDLNKYLVNVATKHEANIELNVLVIGMPNVGKSTLLNALRHSGIKGPTAKALRTSAQPGLTQALSTRLKICLDPPIYAFDSPGVMLPFLGKGEEGSERGVKLALIAGIRESMTDLESLAGYLLYRLSQLNPTDPAYMQLLPPGTPPPGDLDEFLVLLAQRMGMVKRGGEYDLSRAAVYFIRWWREEGGLLASSVSSRGWGFDFEWPAVPGELPDTEIQQKMEECIDAYVASITREDLFMNNLSITQQRKEMKKQELLRKRAKWSRTH